MCQIKASKCKKDDKMMNFHYVSILYIKYDTSEEFYISRLFTLDCIMGKTGVRYFKISKLQLIVVTDCTNMIKTAFFYALIPAMVLLTIFCLIITKIQTCSDVAILP